METAVLATPNDEWPEDWSKDGRYLAYGSNSGGDAFGDLYALPLFGDRKPIPVALSPFAEDEPRFSFDGKWLAYNSNESRHGAGVRRVLSRDRSKAAGLDRRRRATTMAA